MLAYVVEVTNGKNIRDMVFVDANTNKVINRYSMVADALERELIEASGTPQAPVFTTVWEEGDPFPGSLNAGPAEPGQPPPVSPTGCSRTPSAATPTTARART